MKAKPTLERVNQLFAVDLSAGKVVHKHSYAKARAGQEAGGLDKNGYRRLSIDGVGMYAHQVLFFVAYGCWPTLIDHINGQRADNRIENLRDASADANNRNRTRFVSSNLPGTRPAKSGKWISTICADGAAYHLGVYDTEQEAHEAYKLARDRVAQAELKARTEVLLALYSDGLVNEVTRGSKPVLLAQIQADRMAA